MRIRALFGVIFRERYNYITEAGKMSCRACKWPFRANVENPDNVDGGHRPGVPGFGIYTPATKNLKFCKFFIFNELPTFLGIFF